MFYAEIVGNEQAVVDFIAHRQQSDEISVIWHTAGLQFIIM
jgi:hypothetical protein